MKKILVIFLVGFLIITATLPAVSSSDKKVSNTLNIENIDDDCGCGTYKVATDDVENEFPDYPVMKDTFIFFDLASESPKPSIMPTPDEFSWLDYNGEDWTTVAKTQFCGDCWDFAALGAFESIINIREECSILNPDLSEQYVLSCLPGAGSCHGGNPYWAFKLMMEETPEGNYQNGALPESCFPYQGDDDVPCFDKCPDWEEKLIPILDCGYWTPDGSAQDREAIKTQVMENGPVVTGIKSTDYFQLWLSTHHEPDEYYPYFRQVYGMNHVVVIVGWKEDSSIPKGGYWICKNSWGENCGYNGFFNIEYNSLNIDKSMIAWVDYDPESVDWEPIADAGGVYFGDIDEEITFNADESYDPDGDIISYYWDFGDGSNDTGVTTTHSYSEQGIYQVTLTITDDGGNIVQDVAWAGIEEDIDPPNAPEIDGQVNPEYGQVYEYTFTTIDPNSDNIFLYVDWGEYYSVGQWFGPYSSGEEVLLAHTWSSNGNHIIKAKAKDIYGLESEWGYLEVSVPVNQPVPNQQSSQQNIIPLFFKILQQMLHMTIGAVPL